ncbi:MAG: hypothetical protein M1812_003870 [Candelaria pacifica]|nr:MAG: hypothetical protein M1812_003870 [Candelaria pacifica]
MVVLVTGGTGKTAGRLVDQLKAAQIPFLIASRRGASAAPHGMTAVKFDWTNESTFSAPFHHSFPNNEKITAVYLVAPDGVSDPAPIMNNFIDYALKEQGVKRYTLLTGSSLQKGGFHVGKVWSHLADDLAPAGVEYSILLATWFMENFSEQPLQAMQIRAESKFYSATYDGKIPFVSAHDIAAVAFRTLTDSKPHNTEYRVIGGELLTHDDIAAKLSHSLGRKVEHVKVSESGKAEIYMRMGAPESYSKFLATLETAASGGAEDCMNDNVEKVTGKKPVTFDVFVAKNRGIWV